MPKLEEKLIQLGYVKLTHNYMTRLTRYKKEFAFSHINFYIRDNEIVMYGVCPTCDYQTQYEIDDLQEAYNQLQKDLEVLKGGFKRMKKYQEALNSIISSKPRYSCKNDLAVIQELVDKEKGRKPIYKDDGYGMRYYFCESCNERIPLLVNCIDQHKYPYCPYCGQKLDWSDNE